MKRLKAIMIATLTVCLLAACASDNETTGFIGYDAEMPTNSHLSILMSKLVMYTEGSDPLCADIRARVSKEKAKRPHTSLTSLT